MPRCHALLLFLQWKISPFIHSGISMIYKKLVHNGLISSSNIIAGIFARDRKVRGSINNTCVWPSLSVKANKLVSLQVMKLIYVGSWKKSLSLIWTDSHLEKPWTWTLVRRESNHPQAIARIAYVISSILIWSHWCFAADVVCRRAWNAVDPRDRTAMKSPAQNVIVHHTALLFCSRPRDSVSQLAHIQRMHMQERGFDDIGYK